MWCDTSFPQPVRTDRRFPQLSEICLFKVPCKEFHSRKISKLLEMWDMTLAKFDQMTSQDCLVEGDVLV